ncbi:ROK family transcriptional regulator [Solwaraspora sp. WMMA2080]|uniref:ROK family transcriptional regulator n=1 Tax=unclassified Solwaraspora TaxID=2627926 RepID=UPI00248CC269|nr:MULTISPECIES: ROK family transcriptional regulator [unclassified Solwaraspora]WBB95361.1 ROK family transcriptional regulator [Solwaraspora sp. WMMA2059]WBC20733.1 ROK family transcriptional regulator [Solwaraspora sp. WMMA2080]
MTNVLGVWPENTHQAQILRLLRDGPCSRAELGDAVGLSRSKVATELDRMIDRGLVETAGPAASRGGRPSSIVRIAAATRFLSIDIGASTLDVALTDGELQVVTRMTERTELRQGPTTVIAQALELVTKLAADSGTTRFTGAGIGVPGPVSVHEGVPVSPPFMPGWHRFPVREMFSTELGCPVLVDNDVNIMALGEKHAGIARSFDDFLFVKIGAGIGAGIVVGGDVYRGANGCAGDIGHTAVDENGPQCLCGNVGCLEAYFGGAALTRDAVAAARAGRSDQLAEQLARIGTLTALDVTRAAAAGDPVAVGMVRDGGRRVGQVLARLVSFFNPGMVVIGGGLAGMGHALLAEIRSVVYRSSLPLATGDMPIVLSELGDQAGLIGATRMISDHVFTAG